MPQDGATRTAAAGAGRPPADAAAAGPASVGWWTAVTLAAAVSVTQAWLLTRVLDPTWPDWVILLLMTAPLSAALAVRPWFTLTHLHWWAAVFAATLLSLAPQLVLLVGTAWVLTHTVRAWPGGYWRPAPPFSAPTGDGDASRPMSGVAR